MKLLGKSIEQIIPLIEHEYMEKIKQDIIKSYTIDKNKYIYSYTENGKKYLPLNLDLYKIKDYYDENTIVINGILYEETDKVKEILSNEENLQPSLEALIKERTELVSDNEIITEYAVPILKNDILEIIDLSQKEIMDKISNKKNISSEQIERYKSKYEVSKKILENNDENSEYDKILEFEANLKGITVKKLAEYIVTAYEASVNIGTDLNILIDSTRIYFLNLLKLVKDKDTLIKYITTFNTLYNYMKTHIANVKNIQEFDDAIKNITNELSKYKLELK